MTMSPDRAQEIVTAINDRALITMGIPLTRPTMSLDGIGLAEMIEAKTIVEAQNEAATLRQQAEGGTSSIKIVPDDRLIAAAYALQHYDPSGEPILCLPVRDFRGTHRALAVVYLNGDEPEDNEDGED